METSLMLFLSTLIAVVFGRPEYQNKIPNGNKVPNPCPDGGLWPGVGHEAKEGGGPRSDFGKEFFNNGKIWTPELCQKDSDGDGLTNGMELGDPSCTWTEGATPAKTTNLSHPGICEPLTSSVCYGRNNFLPANCLPSTTLLPSTVTTAFSPPSPGSNITEGQFPGSASIPSYPSSPSTTVPTVAGGQQPPSTPSFAGRVRAGNFLNLALLVMIAVVLMR